MEIRRGFSSTYEAKRQNEVFSILLLDEVMDKPCCNVDVNNLVCNNVHPLHYCSTIDPNLGNNPHNLIHISPEEPLQDASLSNNGVKFCLLNAQSLSVASDIGEFFVQRIERIHAEFDSSALETSHSSVPEFTELMSRFDSFDILNEENVKDLISKSSKKSCSLDPMPTSLVLKCQDILLPVITRMINLSLQSGVFCDEWKQALVQPQLKKSKSETVFENLRPISNLTSISKLTERAVFNQTNDYLNLYQLYPKAQSAYRN